jgi:tetratricopeptide (TPR) repeat protein
METLTFEQHYDQAKELAQSGRHKEAEAIFEKLSAEKPDNADILYWIGIVRLEVQNFKAALEPLLKATLVSSEEPNYHFCLGFAHAGLQRHGEAANSFERAVKLDATRFDALFNLAKALKNMGNLDDAAAIYTLYLNDFPEDQDTLYNLANLSFELDKLTDAQSFYEKLLALNPSHLDASVNLALVLSQLGFLEDAVEALNTVLDKTPEHGPARGLLNSLMSRQIPGWHLDMIRDSARNEAYNQAISKAVPNAENILEIGAGSGLLSMMAVRAGAKKVIACEMSAPLATIARQVIADNNYSDQITILHKKSTNLTIGEDLPARSDLLITEIFDVGLLGEHCLPTLLHARENLLTEDATIIPAAAKLKAFLISCPDHRETLQIKTISGFDLSAFDVFRRLESQMVQLDIFEHTPLSQDIEVTNIDFQNAVPSIEENIIDVKITEDGTCDGVVFWFELVLDDEFVINTRKTKKGDHWLPVVQLFDQSTVVKKNDKLTINIYRDLTDFTFSTVQS